MLQSTLNFIITALSTPKFHYSWFRKLSLRFSYSALNEIKFRIIGLTYRLLNEMKSNVLGYSYNVLNENKINAFEFSCNSLNKVQYSLRI